MSRCYTQLALADQRRLHQLVAAKVPVNEMARQLGRRLTRSGFLARAATHEMAKSSDAADYALGA